MWNIIKPSQWHREGLGWQAKVIPTTEDSGEDCKRKEPVNVYAKKAWSSVNNGMDLQQVLKNSIQFWTQILIREKIVVTELSFYRDTHKANVMQQPDLIKINGISHDEQFMCPPCWTWSSMWFCFAAIKQRCCNCAAIL